MGPGWDRQAWGILWDHPLSAVLFIKALSATTLATWSIQMGDLL